ncbi:MAG: 2TM domain-containing protein [Nostoc sp. CmiVER01]|uniref:2TM domain-containing protein n=1 Tax=Nostoc sp. CmiVER01 TaxID=3075384 RepID=UPI002AD5019C|nr:2TM domain-containing protein [Nostoc sp. CmiVER01]MDZ8122651.1 2TM domain-containing protein [Nostoc sp. CmiVER01]
MTTFEPKSLRFYSQDDVQQILQLAIARQADDKDTEFSYEQILEIAAELEILPESLKLAERDWVIQQGQVQRRKAFDAYRIRRFQKRLGNYAIFNGFFILLNLITGGGISWSLYILLFCGLPVGLDVWNTFQMKDEEYEMAFQKWNRKHEIKKTISTVLNKWFKALQA